MQISNFTQIIITNHFQIKLSEYIYKVTNFFYELVTSYHEKFFLKEKVLTILPLISVFNKTETQEYFKANSKTA